MWVWRELTRESFLRRSARRRSIRLTLALLLAGWAVTGWGPMAFAAQHIIISDDRGGPLAERISAIADLRKNGTYVEISGRYCMSACTLYLGLARTCVAPGTMFGFHGPSSPLYGIALPKEEFEYWSKVMARHYPEPLRTWFINTGRFRTVGFYNVSGKRLIALGIRPCPDH